MIEPTLALQTAIRSALIASSSVIAFVPKDQIRSGSTRPDKLPTIIMSGGQTEFLGYAAGSQYIARVFLDLHIWALDDGADTAQGIGFAVCTALQTAPNAIGFSFDDFSRPVVRWMRDPDPALSYAHGVITLEAVIRWNV